MGPDYVSRWHASVLRRESRDVDMLVLSKFGFFAVRNTAWSRSYLSRLAEAVEARTYLCSFSDLPENYGVHAVTSLEDACHIAEASQGNVTNRRKLSTFLHFV